jgi:hypothetical protein
MSAPPALNLPLHQLSKEQIMEQFMDTMLQIQEKQQVFTWDVGFAVANGSELSFKNQRKRYSELQELTKKAKDLKAAYARR